MRQPVLEVRNLTKRYRNGTLANDSLSLELHAGEILGLLGPNGAGKTTLVRQVLGLVRPTSGTLRLDGVDIVADPGFARRNIGFLPQGTFDLQSLTVAETIEFAARLRGVPAAEARATAARLVDRLDLGEFRRTAMHAASGGVRRLAGFAAAIAAPVRLLVLDEPTNDVDPLRRAVLWELIAEIGAGGGTILLVTHNLAEAERVVDRVAIMSGGRIVSEGTPAELRRLVTERLRLELTTAAPVALPPSLSAEAGGAYLFDAADLPLIAAWLAQQRETGAVTDFRITPPTLDDIYAAVMAPAPGALAAVGGAR